jgi:catalase
MPVGKMILDRNPENFFTQVEQAAFCPANLVPGIEFTDDKMLQGRTFSYVDTQRYRLGANFNDLPTNKPLANVANNQRDGAMQTQIFKGSVNFGPSSRVDQRQRRWKEYLMNPLFRERRLVRRYTRRTTSPRPN